MPFITVGSEKTNFIQTGKVSTMEMYTRCLKIIALKTSGKD